jgi:hypothetical protein
MARETQRLRPLIWGPSSPLQKIFRFSPDPNHPHIPAVSSHLRGGSRSSRTRGGMRWTRRAPDESAGRGRRSRVVLTPRCWCQVGDDASHHTDDGGKKARSPRRARNKPLKPLRAGMPGDPGGPVVATLVCHQHFAHEAAGAAGTRHSPRPQSGVSFGKTRVLHAAGSQNCVNRPFMQF